MGNRTWLWESPSAPQVDHTTGQLCRATRYLCIPTDLASLASHFTGLLGSTGGCWGRPKPLSCPLAWAQRRMQGSLCPQGVLSSLCSKGGQAQPQAQPLNLSDGGVEQEPHSKLRKCGRNRTPQQVSGHLQGYVDKTNLLSPRSRAIHPAKTHAESNHYRHVCQAGEDDCAQIPHDRHPGRPDPTEIPKNCPLNQRDMRKLFDLQMVIYNTLLTPPHFIHCLHTLLHLPHPLSPSKKQAERKSLLATAFSQTIRCSASPCQHTQLTHYSILSHFSLKTGWCLGLLIKSSR